MAYTSIPQLGLPLLLGLFLLMNKEEVIYKRVGRAENRLLLQDLLFSWSEAHRCIQGMPQKGDDVDMNRVNCFRIGQVAWVWPERLTTEDWRNQSCTLVFALR